MKLAYPRKGPPGLVFLFLRQTKRTDRVGTREVNRNGVMNVSVEAGGAQVVAHAGLHALGAFADRIGLGRTLGDQERAEARHRQAQQRAAPQQRPPVETTGLDVPYKILDAVRPRMRAEPVSCRLVSVLRFWSEPFAARPPVRITQSLSQLC